MGVRSTRTSTGGEWVAAEERWRIYGNDELIEDPCLYKPLPVRALLDAVAADPWPRSCSTRAIPSCRIQRDNL